MGVKGGCSPQNNRENLGVLNELPAGGNKILHENFCIPRQGPWYGKKSDELEEMNDEVRPAKLLAMRNRQRDRVCTTPRRGL